MKITSTLILAVALSVLSVGLAAQSAPPVYPILIVTRVVVKAERVAEYLEIEKQYSAIYKKGGAPWRRVFRSRTGRANEFMITLPISKYAQLDGDSYFVKGASEGDRLRLSTRRNQVIESATTTYEELVPGAAISTAGTPKNLMIVARLQVAPAKVDEFIEFAKGEVLPVMTKAGVTIWTLRRTYYGGSRSTFVTRRTADTFAELDSSIVTKALGEEGAKKYTAKLTSLISNAIYDIYIYQSDLSYNPQ